MSEKLEKLNKYKWIIIGCLAGFIALNLILSAVTQLETHSFKTWVFDTYGVGSSQPEVKLDKPTMTTPIFYIAVMIIFASIFVGTAVSYARSKTPKKQGRKWPYIVILIISIIGLCIAIYNITLGHSKVFKIADDVPTAVKDSITSKLTNSYGFLGAMSFISPIMLLLIATTNILALTNMSKIKELGGYEFTMMPTYNEN